jgi:hypothetical protein
MQPNYRAIFTEMLNAQTAAVAAFVDVSARCAELVRQECQAALETRVKETQPKRAGKGADAGSAQPRGGSGLTGVSPPWPADFCRAFAGLPRVLVISFLAHYDDLRGRRPVVPD